MVLISKRCLCVCACCFYILAHTTDLLNKPTHKHFTNQQTIGGVDCKTAREGVVYGQPVHIGGFLVASLLVNIPTHVKVQRVAALLSLLTHVL